MKFFLFSLLLAPLLCAAEKPNVIYILADDLGYGDLSCYGQTKFKTPHIDSLAADGMKFTNHYSGNTVCSPSRAVLMTGIESGKNYLRGNVPGEAQAAMPEELTVLPEVFKTAGYRTGAFGKWGLGETHKTGKESPHTHGFDEFCGWKSQMIAHTYYPSSYVRNGKEIPLDGKTYLHPIVMDAAREFISTSAKADSPFFCYIPTAIPHAAMHAPKELHEKWRKVFPQFDEKIGQYGAGPNENTPDVVNPIAGFAAMMEHLDNEVGSILNLLTELGIEDDTIVMFASDNGAHLEGGHDPRFFDSTGGLRGHKRDMHEGGIKTPMLARWPGHILAGSTTHLLSGFHDILPTMAEVIDQPIPGQNTGISFLPTLTNDGEQAQHDYLYIEFTQGSDQILHSQALRFDKWKVYKKAKGGSLELFDLSSDPYEKKNLAKDPQYAEIVKKAKGYLKKASEPIQ
ncbi:arylsulfatase [Roseibacillus persicicus]|uniref:Arylsulfatase n=1 Tax=Roseibacillus persicicus TaxID=454148 RepID=A0A918TKT6_9BACT|nr:arylsulfatase [Roseibacillus persicicus]GHC49399.1 arylsulfatase [Roseibacillus persicicus]